MSREQRNLAWRRAYLREGRTLREIAASAGKSWSLVRKVLRELETPMRPAARRVRT